MNILVTIIDADKCVLGRVATRISKRLLQGETIHVVNADKAFVSGASRKTIRERYIERYHLGTYRKGPFMKRMPHDLFKRTVRGMLPYQQPKGREALKRLKCHIGVPAELAGQNIEVIDAAHRRPRGAVMTVGEIAREMGAPYQPEDA